MCFPSGEYSTSTIDSFSKTSPSKILEYNELLLANNIEQFSSYQNGHMSYTFMIPSLSSSNPNQSSPSEASLFMIEESFPSNERVTEVEIEDKKRAVSNAVMSIKLFLK
jgi:hypothetical protein